MTTNSPPRCETTAGRLSSTLSLRKMYTGPVHALPSYEITYSDHEVPIGVQTAGCMLRNASQSLPEASTVSLGRLLRGLLAGQGCAFDARCVKASGLERSHPLMSPCRPPPSSRISAKP